jgi:hypothetical protein
MCATKLTKIKKTSMKHLTIILLATIVFASCKSKDNLQTDKNIVIMTDTSRAAGSYLNDTGLAKKPVAVAPVAAAPAPTRRTTTTRQRSSTRYGNSSSSTTNNNSTVNNTGSGTSTPQRNRKAGISKGAKGAIIGGVGGAVIGGVIGKNVKGAVIGGAVGAAGGYIIGRSKDRKDGRIP